MKPIAYDYTKQRWVTDPRRAMELRIQQLSQALELLTGPRAKDYARFTGLPEARIPSQVAVLQAIVRELKRDLAGMVSHENFNHSCR